jgi:hypothetical protein
VGGQVQPGVGGKLLQLLPHPHALRSVWHTQKQAKIGTVSATAWHFGPEDLVTAKFVKRAWAGLL